MTQLAKTVLLKSVIFDFSGSGMGDQFNSGKIEMEKLIEMMEAEINGTVDENSECDLSEMLEEACDWSGSAGWYTQAENGDTVEGMKNVLAALKAGEMVGIPDEQIQVVFAPLVAKDGEANDVAMLRIENEAEVELKSMCDDGDGPESEDYDEDDWDEDDEDY